MTQRPAKGFISLLLIILIALLTIGMISMAVIKRGGFSPQPGSEEKASEIPADWLTYENSIYLYKIRYDPRFHAQKENEPPYPPPPAGMSFTKKWDNGEYCDFSILSWTSSFDGEIAQIRSEGKDVEHTAKISGLDAIYFDAQGGNAISRSYYVSNKGVHYRFGYNYQPAAKYSQECGDIVAKMVASFEVTEPTR